MPRALLLSVRFHDGRYHGERVRGAGEWPPSPARLFQALVAGASRSMNLDEDDREAFKWLENLDAPMISAPIARKGQPFSNFVPNNDSDLVEARSKSLGKILTTKTICPHVFDARLPILFIWSFRDSRQEEGHAQTICKIADELYQLGRGVDMAWAQAEILDGDRVDEHLFRCGGVVHRPSRGGSGMQLSCPWNGSLASLEKRFKWKRFRLSRDGRKVRQLYFSQAPRPSFAQIAYDRPSRRYLFELRNVDRVASFASQPLITVATLVQEVRDQAAKLLCPDPSKIPDEVRRYLIGRGASDADKAARVHIVPIPSIGHSHADMMIRRLAVYLPQSCPLSPDHIDCAFDQVVLTSDEGVIDADLQRVNDDSMIRRFQQRGQRWQSVTPLVLPLPPGGRSSRLAWLEKRNQQTNDPLRKHAIAAVHQAVRHAGVHASIAEVRVQKEPFDHNSDRAELFAAGTRFPKEALWHVAIRFATSVAGPLLLGNGRYLGLGLMRLNETMPDVLAFTIEGGLTDAAEPALIARAARRAMMARVQENLPRNKLLRAYVSGHAKDGSLVRGDVHYHIAVVADLPRQRIVYIAPTRLQRRGVRWRDIRENHRLTVRALEGMDILRAGKAGRLRLAPTFIDAENDPLFSIARVWESVTEYDVTRHRRRLSDGEALRADVAAELERCGWPRLLPDAMEVLAERRGPRGMLSGRLRLVFPTAQPGPLLIGRTAHKGGGLFAGF